MISREHPLTKTFVELRRSIMRLEAHQEVSPGEAAGNNTQTVIDYLRMAYQAVPKEFRK